MLRLRLPQLFSEGQVFYLVFRGAGHGSTVECSLGNRLECANTFGPQFLELRLARIGGPWSAPELAADACSFCLEEEGAPIPWQVEIPPGDYKGGNAVVPVLSRALNDSSRSVGLGLRYSVELCPETRKLTIATEGGGRFRVRAEGAQARTRGLLRLLGFESAGRTFAEKHTGDAPVDFRHHAVFICCSLLEGRGRSVDASLAALDGSAPPRADAPGPPGPICYVPQRPALFSSTLGVARTTNLKAGDSLEWEPCAADWAAVPSSRQYDSQALVSFTISVVDVDGCQLELDGLRGWVCELVVRAVRADAYAAATFCYALPTFAATLWPGGAPAEQRRISAPR